MADKVVETYEALKARLGAYDLSKAVNEWTSLVDWTPPFEPHNQAMTMIVTKDTLFDPRMLCDSMPLRFAGASEFVPC